MIVRLLFRRCLTDFVLKHCYFFCGSCVWYFKYDIGAYLSRMHDVGMNIHHHNYHYSQSQNTFTHLLVNIRSTSTDGGYEWVLKRWLDGDFKFCVRKATRVDISWILILTRSISHSLTHFEYYVGGFVFSYWVLVFYFRDWLHLSSLALSWCLYIFCLIKTKIFDIWI